MKLLVISLLLVSNLTALLAQEKSAPAFKMVEFHMALLKRGPQWTAEETTQRKEILAQHLAYFTSLVDTGKAVIGGPLIDESEIRGLYILRAKSASEAREWADADPAVKAGHFSVEMHPWWSEEVMKKAASPMKMTTAYIGFLTRGAKMDTGENAPNRSTAEGAHGQHQQVGGNKEAGCGRSVWRQRPTARDFCFQSYLVGGSKGTSGD